MTVIIYIVTGFCLAILQTTVLPGLPLLDRCYDLLIPYIIYLGLNCSPRVGMVLALTFGLVMDNLSGGPFGLYLVIYFWLFAGFRWMRKYLHAGHILLLPFVIAAAVLIENVALLGTVTLIQPEFTFPGNAWALMSAQIVWALVSGPVLLWLFGVLCNRWEGSWQGRRSRNGQP